MKEQVKRSDKHSHLNVIFTESVSANLINKIVICAYY